MEEKIQLLWGKDVEAYPILLELENISDHTSQLYPYREQFIKMVLSSHTYVRIRGLRLLAHNVKWDKEDWILEHMPSILSLLQAEKPVVVRECLKTLAVIVAQKPLLGDKIKQALDSMDISQYQDSMAPLIKKDKEAVLQIMTKQT